MDIVLSADDEVIEKASERARQENTTLGDQIRLWLTEYARPTELDPKARRERAARAMRTIEEVRKTLKLRGPFTRDEMNER